MNFLFVKPAHMGDEMTRHTVAEDILSLEQTLIKIHKDVHIDICAVTVEGEWLIHGRKIVAETKLKLYDRVFSFAHSVDPVGTNVKETLKLFANKHTHLYKAEDEVFHNSEKLAELIKINNIEKFAIRYPTQKHVNMKEYNDQAVTTLEIVARHMRDLFLPIHTLETNHSKYKNHKIINLSYNAKEFVENIDQLRHRFDEVTFREYIDGQQVYVAVIPDYKDEDFYVCLPLVEKTVNDIAMFEVANLNMIEKEGVKNIAKNISKISFPHQAVVYKLTVHKKRGVFVQHSSSLLTYLLYYPDFVFETVGSLGLGTEEFIDKVL